MATYIATTAFIPTFLDDNGDPLNGGTLESYVANTTTPTPTFTGEAGVSAGDIITLNARGEPQTSGNTHQVWIDSAIKYDFVLKTAAGVIINSPEDVSYLAAGSVASVLNIAAAKALAILEDTQAVYIRGYTTEGDGGGGMYVYDASSAATANDGTVLALDTLPGRLLHGETTAITVKTFGAVGDGVADDTAAIQATIDTGEAVRAPKGTYSFTELSCSYNTLITGSGMDETVFVSSSNNVAIVFNQPALAAQRFQCNFGLMDLQVQAKNAIECNPVITTLTDLNALSRATFKRSRLVGTYDIATDVNAGDEVTVPDYVLDLEPLGVGLKTNKMYALDMSGLYISGFGVGWASFGDTVGQIKTSRISSNARNIHRELAPHLATAAGMGADFHMGPALDILDSARMGSLFIKGTRDDKFESNYMENKNNTNPSMLWYFEGIASAKIINNHLNPVGKTGSNRVMAHFDLSFGNQISGNSIQPWGAGFTPDYSINFVESYEQNYPDKGFYFSNSFFPDLDKPHLRVTPDVKNNLFNHNNQPQIGYRPIGGTVTDNANIWEDDATYGWILKQSNISADATIAAIVNMNLKNPDALDTICLTVTGGIGNGFFSVERVDTSTNILSGNVLQGFGATFGTIKYYIDVGSIEKELEIELLINTNATKIAKVEAAFALRTYGTTGERPSALTAGVGFNYWDSSLSKPLSSNGLAWEDATGAVV